MTRCDKLREKICDSDAVYISSYPNIFYYSGFTSEDASLVITKNRQVLFTDSRYITQAKIEASDFEVYDIFSDMEKVVKDLGVLRLLFEEEHITIAEFSRIRDKFGLKPVPFSKEIKEPRRIKDELEIKKIAEAEALGDAAFSYILDRIKPGMSEREIAIDLEFFMKKNGARALSFETIVASGVRSAMPHGVASDKLIKRGELLTLDFGCILDGYCSDMTRTVAVGSVDGRQKEIYDVVLKAQKAALSRLGTGVLCKDADKAARDVISEAGYGKFFAHATGHSVGVEIHELPSLSPKSENVLEAGNIVTVEPGIYIEDFCGVRIEDLVQIGAENVVNLTKSEKDLLII